MIEKLPGVTLVNKLRAILLMETDFNFGNRLIIGKKMVQGLEKENSFLRIALVVETTYVQLKYLYVGLCFLMWLDRGNITLL